MVRRGSTTERGALGGAGVLLIAGLLLLISGLVYIARGTSPTSEATSGTSASTLPTASEEPGVPPPAPVAVASKVAGDPDPGASAESAAAQAQALLVSLAKARPDVLEEAERVVWTDGATTRFALAVNGTDPPEFAISTEDGRLRIPPNVFALYPRGPPAVLPVLIERAVEAGLDLSSLALRSDAQAGPRLQSRGHVVFPDVVLPRVASSIAKGYEASLRARLADAAETFVEGLPADGLDPTSRKAIAAVLGIVAQPDNAGHIRVLPPSMTRRLIRHGWLGLLDPDPALRQQLEDAVDAAETMRAWVSYESDEGRLTSYRDAFSRRLVVVVTPSRSAFSRVQPPPEFFSGVPGRTLVVEMPPGSDPTADGVKPLAARVFVGSREVAAWSQDDGFHADPETWDRVLRPERHRDQAHLAPGWFPPHVLVTDAEDDVVLLATAHGEIRPASSGSDAETKRFMDEVTRALPDAAHLDLIGELLYDYAWDTAEYDRPLLVGTYEHNGDLHQTLSQTLATCAGGTYRGDCDDLAGFYHTLSRHLGRNAHVLSLPSHLACAWAEQLPDGEWAVSVLHTGQPYTFVGSSAADAIRTAYEHFNATEVLDPSALPVSLRFSGEPTREEYLLSSRIFSDRAYADELIRVQADWHLHTYLSGIRTMEQVVRREGAIVADHGELAALYEAADMRGEAIFEYERAITLATQPQTRVALMTRRLSLLVVAKDDARAAKQAGALLTVEIPALESARDARLVTPWIGVASILLSRAELAPLGLEVLARRVVARLEPSFERLGRAIEREGFDPYRLVYGDFPMHLENLSAFVGAAVAAVEVDAGKLTKSGRSAQALVDRTMRRWIDGVAFPIQKKSDSMLDDYAFIASYHAAHMGYEQLVAAVGSAKAPQELPTSERQAIVGGEPSRTELAFASIAPAFWEWVWARALAPQDDDDDGGAADDAVASDAAFEPAKVVGAVRRHGLAVDGAEAIGLGHAYHPVSRLEGRVVAALVSKDGDELESAFAAVAARNDRRLEDQIAGWVGRVARHLDLTWFTEAMKRWNATLEHKPNHFRIVWAAVTGEAPAHGLVAARMAAARYPDDEAFRAELRHLESKYGK